MRLGVIADVHGNDVALRAVLDDAARHRVDQCWVLGDLVLFGPRPAEVLDLLRGLPGVCMLRGNTDRYVLTGEQPAPPVADDGPGIDPHLPGPHLDGLLAGCGADVVVGGHTHYQVDRMVAGIRALNPGSTGMPRPPRQACWLLLHDGARHDGIPPGLTAEFHRVPFDVDAVVRDLHRRRHPNAAFVQRVLTAGYE